MPPVYDVLKDDNYAVQTRHPGEWEPVTKADAQRALERAVLVLAWVEAQLER